MRTQIYEIARRSIIQTLRQPALVIPPVIFPLIMMAINTGGLNAATNLPGFPADTLPRLRDRGPVHAGVAVRVHQRRRVDGARRRDAGSSSAWR